MNWVEGQELTPLTKPEITKEQLREYAEVSGDSNPIHLDEEFAKEAGFPSVIAHGMISMAFLGDFIRLHFPEDQFDLIRFKTRFRKITFPGDQVTCSGKVKSLDGGSVLLSLSVANQQGEATCDGEALLKPR